MTEVSRLSDGTDNLVAVGSRDQMLSFLQYHVPDGQYADHGPGIDATFYRVSRVVYPAGGRIDGMAVPTRSVGERLRFFDALNGDD
jgi:hypothetical protein